MAGVDNNAAAAAAAAAAAKRAAEEAAKRAAAAAAKAAAAAAAKKAAASSAAKQQAHAATPKTAPLQHQTATANLKDANHASGTSNKQHGAATPLAGAFGALEHAVGSAIHAVEPPKPISADDAHKQLTQLQSQFHAAKTPKEVASVSQHASDLKARMWATDHLAHGKQNLSLRQGVDQLTTASNRANSSLQQLHTLHTQMNGSAADRAAATANLLAHPNLMKGTIKNLQDVPPALAGHAQSMAGQIASKATPEALGKQLSKDPNLSSYGPDMAKNLATLRGLPDKNLQQGIDAVGKNLLKQSTEANAPAPAAPKGSGIFGAISGAVSDVAHAVAKPADPLTMQAMQSNPALAKIVVPATAHDPHAAQELQGAVDRMGSQSLVQNLDANNKPPQPGAQHAPVDPMVAAAAAATGQPLPPAPGTPQANAANSMQGFQNSMLGLARAGIPPAMLNHAMAGAPAGAANTLLDRGVSLKQVQQNPAYGQVLASVQNDPQFAGRVQSQVQGWAKTSIEQHLQGKEKQSGVDDAEKQLQSDMINVAKNTGLAGPAMSNGIKGALADKGVQSDIKDTANKGKSFWDSIGDVVGGLVNDATHIAGDVAGAVGNAVTGHFGSAFNDVAKGAGDVMAAGGDLAALPLHLASTAVNLGVKGLTSVAAGGLDALGAHGLASTVSQDGNQLANLASAPASQLANLSSEAGHTLGNDETSMLTALGHGHIGAVFEDGAKGIGDTLNLAGKGADELSHDIGNNFAFTAQVAGQAGGGLLRAAGANGAARLLQSGTNAVGKFGQQFAGGFGDGLQGMTSSTAMIVEHPLQTGKGLAYLATHPSALKTVWSSMTKGGVAHALGEVGANLAAVIATGGAGSAGDLVAGAGRLLGAGGAKLALQSGGETLAEGAAEGSAETATAGLAEVTGAGVPTLEEGAGQTAGEAQVLEQGAGVANTAARTGFALRGAERALGVAHNVADLTGSSGLSAGLKLAKSALQGFREGGESVVRGAVQGGEGAAGSTAREATEAAAETGGKSGVRVLAKTGVKNLVNDYKQKHLLAKPGEEIPRNPIKAIQDKSKKNVRAITNAPNGAKRLLQDLKKAPSKSLFTNKWSFKLAKSQLRTGIAHFNAGNHEEAWSQFSRAAKNLSSAGVVRLFKGSAVLGLQFINKPDGAVLDGKAEDLLDAGFGKNDLIKSATKNVVAPQQANQLDANSQNQGLFTQAVQ